MNATTRYGDVASAEDDEAFASPGSLRMGPLAVLVGAAHFVFIVGPPLLARQIRDVHERVDGKL